MAAANEYDAIVIGAGVAGVCCAAELTLRGVRPLLICETTEVCSNLRTEWIGENRALMQHLPLGQNGSYWFPLVRELNIPVQIYRSNEFAACVRGTGKIYEIPQSVSGSAVAAALAEMFPIPVDVQLLSKVMHAGLTIPWNELPRYHDVRLADWLDEQGADEAIKAMVLTLCGAMYILDLAQATEAVSVFGGLAGFRKYLCGEGYFTVPYPDSREGVFIPMAQAIEERGAEVWRGQHVDRIIIENGRVRGAVLKDGTEARAPIVAIAAGNKRIPAFLDPLPAEVAAVLENTRRFDALDFCTYTVHDKAVLKPDHSYIGVVNPDGSMEQWAWPIHKSAPWAVKPGHELLVTQSCQPSLEAVEQAGGEDKIYQQMLEVNEELFPGFTDSTVGMATQKHKHLWVNQAIVGPKLPRTIPSAEGLWFVGDGSIPIADVYTEAATSAGVLGARGIVEALRSVPAKAR